jgi:DNA repair protein RecO (recombination protein O)
VLISTSAIVLKTIPYGDTSIISRMFTEDQGKVTILAKGAWRPKNNAGALLEPMNHIHLQYYHKSSREIQILKDGVFSQQFSNLRKELNKIIVGLAIVEMMDKSTMDNNPFPILYRLGWRVLKKLNDEKQNIWLVFIFFLYQLSLRLGFLPNLKKCSKCNAYLTSSWFDDYTGELVCMDCSTQSKINLEENILSALQKLESLHIDEIHTLSINIQGIANSIQFLDTFISFHSEGLKKVRSMEMVQQILNNEINPKK